MVLSKSSDGKVENISHGEIIPLAGSLDMAAGLAIRLTEKLHTAMYSC
jgi:hypothetical protein